MTLQFAPTGTVVLKGKSNTISLGNTIRLGEYQVPGMGEYDVAGIPCKVQNLEQGSVAFVQLEGIQFTFLSQIDPGITKLDDATDTEVLVVDVRSDDQASQLKSILKVLEPAFLALIGSGNTEAFRKALGLPISQGASTKIIKSGLPEEGTTLLTA